MFLVRSQSALDSPGRSFPDIPLSATSYWSNAQDKFCFSRNKADLFFNDLFIDFASSNVVIA